ncbi:hypothetical protein EON67_12420, partial [archaeon]
MRVLLFVSPTHASQAALTVILIECCVCVRAWVCVVNVTPVCHRTLPCAHVHTHTHTLPVVSASPHVRWAHQHGRMAARPPPATRVRDEVRRAVWRTRVRDCTPRSPPHAPHSARARHTLRPLFVGGACACPPPLQATMIRWAPLSIPRSRRLQTGAICFALACFPAVWALLFAALFFKPFVQAYSREILVTYLLWQWLLDRNTAKQGGRPSAWVRGWRVWRAASEYFPARLHTPATPYTPHKPHIFCLHPHGVISVAAVANFIWEANEPRRRLGVDY